MPPRRLTLNLAALIGVLALAADQATKAWAQASLPASRRVTAIPGWLWFQLTHNSGATLGLLSGYGDLVSVLSLVILIGVVAVLLRGAPGGRLGAVALGAIAGGALSNLVDRVRYGSVLDFIEIRVWPTDFNLADAAIRIGVVLFIAALFLEYLDGRRAPATGGR